MLAEIPLSAHQMDKGKAMGDGWENDHDWTLIAALVVASVILFLQWLL
jgi:hypothetical protein